MKLKNYISNQKGSTMLIFALAFTVLIALTGLTVDIGLLTLEKTRLTSTIDASALAGGQELITNPSNTENIVRQYVSENSRYLKSLSISINSADKRVTVSGTKNVGFFLSRFIGMQNKDITSLAEVRVENISSLTGARPLAVIQQTFTYGRLYTLKEGGGDGNSGNYAAISLGGTGSSNYRTNLLTGYSGSISVNDIIQTETGNMSGSTQAGISELMDSCIHTPPCTYLSYNKNCSKIIFIPVVNTLDVNGRKYIVVLGFATFFLEGVTEHGGQADVHGRFITYCMDGETSTNINDYGTYGIRLIK